jgi:hypothetical protein
MGGGKLTSEAGAARERDLMGGRYVRVYNKARQSFVATRAKVADGYLSRLVGLLGTTSQWAQPGNGLWIVPSHGVHMLGMLYPLDVIFLDHQYVVVEIEEYLRPFRISKVSLKAKSVLELPIHTISRTETRIGDQLEISPVQPSDQTPLR